MILVALPKTCEYPGCVAYVVPGTTECAVHAGIQGHPCDACGGRGWLEGPPKIPCPDCGGVGLADTQHRPAKARAVKVDTRPLIRAAEGKS